MGQKTGQIHGRDHTTRGCDPIPPGAWRCATPIAPATEPSGYQANSEDAAFQNGWVNLATPDSALRWRFTTQGRVELIGAIDGGALGSVCVTLPAAFRPETDVYAAISSVDGSRTMTVSISSSGDVVVVGIPDAAPGASGSAGGALDGTYPNPGLASSVAGAGLAETSDVLSVNVDGSTIEINSDTLRVKDSGITEAKIGLSDNTTNDVSTSKHGFVPKAPNDTTKFLRGDGTWTTVTGSGAGITQSYIGYNTVGGTTDAVAISTYKQVYKSVTLASAGLLVSIDAYVKGNASNVQALGAAVYDDNAGVPGKVIAHLAAETSGSATIVNLVMNTTARWVSVPLSVYLPAGTYWLVIITGNVSTLHYDASGGDYTQALTSTWTQAETSAPTNSSRKYSIRGCLIQ